MPQSQKPPQRIEAPSTEGSSPATFIFLHGYGDDADGWINIAHQFHSANKLPHLTWLFPNAPHNHEAMTTAWYTPTSFSPIPVGRSSSSSTSTPEDEFAEDHEAEIFTSVSYISTLIESELSRGVPLNRIIVGGFSQGCAVSLVLGLASKYAGKIGAVVGLSGYLPRGQQIQEGREKFEKGGGMRVFLAHGGRDLLVPMRVFRDTKERVKQTVGEEALEAHEYEGMGHVTSGPEFRDMCAFLEKVVP